MKLSINTIYNGLTKTVLKNQRLKISALVKNYESLDLVFQYLIKRTFPVFPLS